MKCVSASENFDYKRKQPKGWTLTIGKVGTTSLQDESNLGQGNMREVTEENIVETNVVGRQNREKESVEFSSDGTIERSQWYYRLKCMTQKYLNGGNAYIIVRSLSGIQLYMHQTGDRCIGVYDFGKLKVAAKIMLKKPDGFDIVYVKGV